MRLSLDRRAAEAGLLFAVGYRRRTVRRLLLAEGTILAAVGAIAGCAAAVGYAWVMLELLRFLWPGGLEQSFLRLHVTPASFAIGYGAALGVSIGTVFWACAPRQGVAHAAAARRSARDDRAASGRPARESRLRAGAVDPSPARLPVRRATPRPEMKAGLFFGGGFLLVVAG